MQSSSMCEECDFTLMLNRHVCGTSGVGRNKSAQEGEGEGEEEGAEVMPLG